MNEESCFAFPLRNVVRRVRDCVLPRGIRLWYACAFYSGDLNLSDPWQNGLPNETDLIVGGRPYGAATFQNFEWNGGTIVGLATNNLSDLNPTTAYWEIRSGISEGNGGTLIASGSAPTTNQPTGRSDFGYNEYTNFVTGMDVHLRSGTYWMSVVPQEVSRVANNTNRSYNSETDGTGMIGSCEPNNQYFDSAFFGAIFTNANNEGVFPALSQAVYAAFPEPPSLIMLPEPPSLILLGSGLLAAAGAFRRRFM